MRTVAELRQALGKAVDELNSEAVIKDPAAFAAKEKEITTLNGEIERQEKALALQAGLAKPMHRIETPPAAPDGKFIRSGSLRYFKGQDAEKRAYRFAQFMFASAFDSPKAQKWCRENGIILTRAESEGVNTQGGVLVPEEFSREIIDLRDQYGMFRRLCTVYPMGRDTMNVPRRTGGLTAYAVGEGVAATLSTASWDNVKLTADKWAVLTVFSSELDEDAAVNIGDLLAGEVAYAFAVAEDTAGFSGDGTSTYHNIRGLLTKFNDQVSGGASTLAGALDAASGHDTFGEIDSTDIANLMAKLPQYVYMRGRPSFLCSQVGWGATFQRIIQGAGGISKDDITGRVVYRYLGFDVEISPAMPTSTGDLSDKAMILFGDVGMAAAFGDRRGMTISRSTEYKFAEDQIAIKGTERFAINVHDLGSTTVPGPIVALIGE